jgi:hypothetical protein
VERHGDDGFRSLNERGGGRRAHGAGERLHEEWKHADVVMELEAEDGGPERLRVQAARGDGIEVEREG